MFWAHIEAEVMRTLQSQSPLPPQNSPFDRVVIPLSPNLAIVSPTTCLLLALQLEIPPLPPRTESELNVAVAQGSLTAFLSLESSFINLPFVGTEENIFLIQILPEILPLPPRMESELNVVVAQWSLTAFLSLESSFINLPFCGTEESIFLIQILHRVPCFKMTIRCHRHNYPTPRTFQLLLNPLTQEFITPTSWDLKSGLVHQANPFNPSKMMTLVWNCRGAGSTSFHRNFLDMARHYRPTIAVIMETRISSARAEEVSSSLGFNNVCRLDASSFSGGIWVLWNSQDTELDILSVTDQTIHAFVQVCPSNPSFSWIFTAIYANPHLSSCLQLWENLFSFASSLSLPWLIAGYFNDITSNNESLSCSPPNRSRISHFNDFLNNCNLLNLGYNGPRCTWSNKRDLNLVMKRLDRALCTPIWQLLFQDTTVTHLPKISSDHCKMYSSLDRGFYTESPLI